jgi:hypothetical protein
MIRSLSLVLIGVAALALDRVHSQSVVGAKSPVQQLQALKAANQALLDKQAGALLKLDELQKEAAQVKFLSKRG